MDDAVAVRLGERAAHLTEDVLDALGRHRAVLLEDVGDAPALDELHDEIEGAVLHLAEVVDLDGVGVLEGGDGSGLAIEARLDRGVVREVLVQGLECDLADRGTELLLGQVHATHAAFAELLDDGVFAGDHGADEGICRLRFALGHRQKGRTNSGFLPRIMA